VGGTHVQVESLSSENQDAHLIQARPALLSKARRADLLVTVGLDLEIGWLPVLQQNAGNPRIFEGRNGFVDASQSVQVMEVPRTLVDRSQGDVHPNGNPHYLYDPRAAALIALTLADRYAQLDPANANEYVHNAERFANEMRAFAEEQSARFAKLPPAKRQVVTYHRSFPYLFDLLGINYVGTVERLPGVAPNNEHLTDLMQEMQRTGTHVILQESIYPQDTSAKISSVTGSQLVVVSGGTHFTQGEKYIDYLRSLIDPLFDALSTN
jgi:zinc/manganese transport system substrate-binding protein